MLCPLQLLLSYIFFFYYYILEIKYFRIYICYIFFFVIFDWSYLENALMLIGGISDKFSAYTNRGFYSFLKMLFKRIILVVL